MKSQPKQLTAEELVKAIRTMDNAEKNKFAQLLQNDNNSTQAKPAPRTVTIDGKEFTLKCTKQATDSRMSVYEYNLGSGADHTKPMIKIYFPK